MYLDRFLMQPIPASRPKNSLAEDQTIELINYYAKSLLDYPDLKISPIGQPLKFAHAQPSHLVQQEFQPAHNTLKPNTESTQTTHQKPSSLKPSTTNIQRHVRFVLDDQPSSYSPVPVKQRELNKKAKVGIPKQLQEKRMVSPFMSTKVANVTSFNKLTNPRDEYIQQEIQNRFKQFVVSKQQQSYSRHVRNPQSARSSSDKKQIVNNFISRMDASALKKRDQLRKNSISRLKEESIGVQVNQHPRSKSPISRAAAQEQKKLQRYKRLKQMRRKTEQDYLNSSRSRQARTPVKREKQIIQQIIMRANLKSSVTKAQADRKQIVVKGPKEVQFLFNA